MFGLIIRGPFPLRRYHPGTDFLGTPVSRAALRPLRARIPGAHPWLSVHVISGFADLAGSLLTWPRPHLCHLQANHLEVRVTAAGLLWTASGQRPAGRRILHAAARQSGGCLAACLPACNAWQLLPVTPRPACRDPAAPTPRSWRPSAPCRRTCLRSRGCSRTTSSRWAPSLPSPTAPPAACCPWVRAARASPCARLAAAAARSDVGSRCSLVVTRATGCMLIVRVGCRRRFHAGGGGVAVI